MRSGAGVGSSAMTFGRHRWSKHDARKHGAYEREKYTGLDRNDFMRLLCAFCASSYVTEHFSMRESDFAYHLSRAKKLTDIVAKEEDFVRDMTISTSPSCIRGAHISLLSSLYFRNISVQDMS